jgi:double-stranded RNA-specific adenosine deaminase
MSAVRSAEKKRQSSCDFANAIASLCIHHFRNICPEDISYKQTVVAAFVLSEEEEASGRLEKDVHWVTSEPGLRVVSMGVGTKIPPAPVFFSTDETDTFGPDQRMRDCHAESLARRGLLRFLHSEARKALLADAPDGEKYTSQSIFMPQDRPDDTYTSASMPTPTLHLRPGVRFHLYCSSAPCGNACFKKFAKSSRPPSYPAHLGRWCFPCAPHPSLHVTQQTRALGQVVLLCMLCSAHQLSARFSKLRCLTSHPNPSFWSNPNPNPNPNRWLSYARRMHLFIRLAVRRM